ncbi:heme utilization cystosolic carrier protein HutX [Hafnia paralvei]|uniref:heme utilization cystosolic carrier protein HutX n=1 Tax=Hafnia paralvei TaxID=546367 RepID=UPI00267156FF|nr:heme utilization cystosolic carrier protein HutX [Hafnia paralvei]
MSTPSSAQQHDLMAYLSTNPDGTVEDIAKRYNVTPLDVIRLTPGAQIFDGTQFDAVWDEITQWGDVTTLVNNDDLILEFHGELPTGTHRHGFFNLRGKKGLSGHIRATHCRHIALVERPFMGMDTASVWFINEAGRAMMKIFVGRDSHRKLLTEQLDAFRTLPSKIATKLESCV